ncbi:LacI family transcriptional regulator [Paraglaciecola aquimarina]|uniref:LacI family transcriptional regulator n=1 Tax=Paraglaciecola algarum TaxID=3050085 RepID=A0ABS9D8Z6_9ALTE|nr:LacI family DNA-binding transcriptional regulator [Paraglaciecola sp. G1-23]MCF2949443.1 LacI family transcriptional regulator [Paraglaciecola sp. G1-23]
MATIRDVAKEAGLSTGTISKALSTPERVSKKNLEKIQIAIKKLKYKPNMLAQKFRAKSSKTIVVLVPDIANQFFASVISGIELVAQNRGYSVLLGDTRDSAVREREFVRMVETKLADGIINLRPYKKEDAILPQDDILSVSASSCEGTPSYSVRIDNVGAAKKAVSHLIALGHKRIGVISGLKENPHNIDRFNGYKAALADANITYDPKLVVAGDFNYWSGLTAAEQFSIMKPRPTAIFSMNDEMAIAAIRGFKDKGINMPEDMSIIGFDDMEVSRYCIPTLTTISQPAEKIGEKSAELLLQLIEGKKPETEEYILPYEFVIRESIAPPKI